MRAAIFDFDGVLVNSEPLHFRALREGLLEDGFAIDEQEYVDHYLAYDDRTAIRLALERHQAPADPLRVDAAARRKQAAFERLMAEVPFFPGARELVRSLAREVPLAIASGARHAEIESLLTAGGLRPAFQAIVGADDVSQGKPHPEPYLLACARLAQLAPGLQPEHCLVFEDSMAGIAAARAAGMTVVAVTNTYPADRLTAAQLAVDSLEGLRLEDLRSLFA